MANRSQLQRRTFLHSALAFPAILSATAFSERKPNVVIIYSDDQGFGDLSCFGAKDLQTPHLDRLASEGLRFNHWYSNAPVCSPSRAALMTGRYPHRAGLPTNAARGLNDKGMHASEITLAEALKPLGYHTGAFGKWHVGSTPDRRPNAQGFDEFYGFLSGCIDYYSHIMYWGQGRENFPYHDLWRNNEEIWENGQYMTFRIADEATKFIRKHKNDPFFLYVPFSAPHYPLHAPKEYFDRFAHIEDPQRRMQAAMVSALDDSVGRILDELDRQGLADDTLVYFQSDNGPSAEQRNLLDDSNRVYHGGSAGPFRGHKGSLFEGGIRVPAMMRFPGRIQAGTVSEEIGVTMDIWPTVVKLVGGELPNDRKIDGLDIWPMIQGKTKSPNQTIHWGLGQQRAVRDGDWKLVLNGKMDFSQSADDKVFLGNLKDDPYESKNVRDSHPDIVEKLTAKIDAWEQDVGWGM